VLGRVGSVAVGFSLAVLVFAWWLCWLQLMVHSFVCFSFVGCRFSLCTWLVLVVACDCYVDRFI